MKVESVAHCRNTFRESLQPLTTNDTTGGTAAERDANKAVGGERYSEIFGKYLVPGKDARRRREEEEQRERARSANKIFRTVYAGAGLAPLFLDSFLLWSDYVQGRVSKEKFIEKVKERAASKARILNT